MTSVAILGAGLSGVAMGMQLRRAGLDDFVIYEERPDVGGTWHRNTYPGLHCDVPSHLYCYSFEPNPEWSTVYASQPEIQAYIRRCAEKYDLIDRTRFDTRVESARFDETECMWRLSTTSGDAAHRIVVAATGGLTAPNIPRLAGLDSFTGTMWHSGAWRDDVALEGQRVAVVGSAASAVQVVPEVAGRAKEVFVFSRTPNWVLPRHNRQYTDDEKRALRDSQRWHALRRQQYRGALYLHRAFKRQESAVAGLRYLAMQHLHASITDPVMIEALTPRYDPGCKRIVVSDEYYPALAQDHVHLVPHGVEALSPSGVIAADGTEAAVDIIIFCTGYRLGGRADGRPALDVVGRGGQTLAAALARRAEAYRGVAVPGFPNYFTICGINGVVASTSLFLSAEAHTAFVARWAARFEPEGLRSIEARPDATRRYNDEIQAELSTMSWTGDCSNFYRDAAGRVVAFHPGTISRMRRELSADHDEDFLLEYR